MFLAVFKVGIITLLLLFSVFARADEGKRLAGFELEFKHWKHWIEMAQNAKSIWKIWSYTAGKTTVVPTLDLPRITQRVLDGLYPKYVEHCRTYGCTVSREDDRFGRTVRIEYPDGYWFAIKRDVTVFEVVGKPVDFSKPQPAIAERMQRDLFDFLKPMGIVPSKFGNVMSAGHLNLDFESNFRVHDLQRHFREEYYSTDYYQRRLLRDFLVDFINHAELSEGLLNYDPNNARSYGDGGSVHEFRRLIDAFDRSQKTDNPLKTRDLAQQFQKKMNNEMGHVYALSLEKLADRDNGGRLEIRAIRAQRSWAEFETAARLFSGRIAFLRDRIKQGLPPMEHRQKVPAGNAEAAVLSYYEFAKNSGVPWADAKQLLRNPYTFYDVTDEGKIVRPGLIKRAAACVWLGLVRY